MWLHQGTLGNDSVYEILLIAAEDDFGPGVLNARTNASTLSPPMRYLNRGKTPHPIPARWNV